MKKILSDIRDYLNFNGHKCFVVYDIAYSPDKKSCQILYDEEESGEGCGSQCYVSDQTIMMTLEVSELDNMKKLYFRNKKINKIIGEKNKTDI